MAKKNNESEGKREGWVSKEEAKALVIKRPDKMVHTFYNPGFGLIGADHEYDSVMNDIDDAEECNITGEQAQAMGHGLAVIPKGCTKQSDILFVETTKMNQEIIEAVT